MGAKSFKPLLCLGVVVVLVTACSQSATPTPTPKPTARPTATLPAGVRLATSLEDIAGTWVGLGVEGLYQHFDLDGTCFTAVSLENLNTNPDVESTCVFEGDVLVMTDVKATGLPSCGGKPGKYQVRLLPNGNILFTLELETCAPRRRSTAMEHEPVPQP